MTWSWQQLYEAVLSEKDRSRLPERLVLAEKAIIQRWQELPEPAQELPEGQALREALNRLYGLYPHEHHPPGQIPDEETAATPRNWMRVSIILASGLTLASAMSWMVARRNEQIDARRMAAAVQTKALRNSRTAMIRDPAGSAVVDGGSYELGLPSAPATRAPAPSTRDRNSGTQNSVRSQGASSQSINSTNSSEAPAARPGAPLVNGVSKAASVAATKADNVENAPEGVDENAPPQKSVDDPQVSASRDSLSQTADEGAGTTSAVAKLQDEVARPKGTVSVSPSAYPSIRVPPELQGQSAVTAESLQIGEAVSRTAPRYPEEAASQGVEGTVKLRAIVGKDGAVENVTVISGPPLLASAAVATVRQWRYKPTLLGDQPVEVAEDISIVFQLANARDPEN